MKSNNLALLTGVTCIAVLATYAWAATQEVTEVKVEEAAAKVEESAEPARLCIPMAEAAEATAAVEETSSESTTEEAKVEESTDEAKAEEDAAETEAALPLCDADGNPPAPEGDEAAAEEKTEEAAEEPAKTE